jgi:hypothetical protein
MLFCQQEATSAISFVHFLYCFKTRTRMVGIHILGSCNFESKNNDQKLKTFGFIKTGKPIALFCPGWGAKLFSFIFSHLPLSKSGSLNPSHFVVLILSSFNSKFGPKIQPKVAPLS